MKLLVAADLHIGRSASHVSQSLDRQDISNAGAWRRIVTEAIRQSVDLVCLCGDIADASNKFWEAIGPLEEGIRRLADAHIRTLAVTGNHDHDVLPRLADQLDPQQFTLLGQGGSWQREVIKQDGRPVLYVDGWSFPDRTVRQSPLDSYSPLTAEGTAVVTMVHGDLDVKDSPYAPLDRLKMQSMPVAGWLLGHIHAPLLINAAHQPFLLYPGSPQAMDPTETGVHGAWLIDLEHGRAGTPKQIPLSSVRYEHIPLDLTGVSEPDKFNPTLLKEIKAQASRAVEQSGGELKYLSLRLHLQGRTSLCRQLRALAAPLQDNPEQYTEHILVGINKILFEAAPAIDLAEHARGQTPLAALARLLLALDMEEPPEEISHLVTATRQELEQVCAHRDYLALPDASVCDNATASNLLKTQAQSLLGELLGQTA